MVEEEAQICLRRAISSRLLAAEVSTKNKVSLSKLNSNKLQFWRDHQGKERQTRRRHLIKQRKCRRQVQTNCIVGSAAKSKSR